MIEFHVPGVPIPQGSMKAIQSPHQAFPRIVHDNASELKGWRDVVRAYARLHVAGHPWDGPVRIWVDFIFARPKSHIGKTGLLACALPIPTPDVDKLVRAFLDALTGVAFVDDRQVIQVDAAKYYGKSDDAKFGAFCQLACLHWDRKADKFQDVDQIQDLLPD